MPPPAFERGIECLEKGKIRVRVERKVRAKRRDLKLLAF